MVWKLQVGAGVSSRWAELDSRSTHFLRSIFHLIQSPGNLHSIDFRSCGSSMPAETEAGVEFINMEVPTERLAGRPCDWACPHPGASWAVLWCHSSLLSLEASCKMCLSPVSPSRRTRASVVPASRPPTLRHLYLMVLDELCTHPTEHKFNEGISFLFLALLLMDFRLWIKQWLSNLRLQGRHGEKLSFE